MKNWKSFILPSAADVMDADLRVDAIRNTLAVTDAVTNRKKKISKMKRELETILSFFIFESLKTIVWLGIQSVNYTR